MTIVLGFTTAHEIILASDSQISFFPSTAKQPDVQKIAEIRFAGSGRALLAKAGNWRTTNDFHRLLEERAAGVEIDTPRRAADVAEAAMREARSRLLTNFHHESLGQEAHQQHVRDFDCEVIFAYFYGGQAQIFTSSLADPRMVRTGHGFETAGCAANIARSILTGFEFKELSHIDALGLAAYAVEACKSGDYGCDGPLQVGTISKADSMCVILPKNAAIAFSHAALIVASDMRAQLLKQVRGTFAAISNVYEGDITLL